LEAILYKNSIDSLRCQKGGRRKKEMRSVASAEEITKERLGAYYMGKKGLAHKLKKSTDGVWGSSVGAKDSHQRRETQSREK